jgi:methane/ammonia monooxygenase subunit C
MSVTADTVIAEEESSANEQNSLPVVVNWATYFKVIAGIGLGYLAYRVYLQKYAFSVGLDSFEPEFSVFWMRLLYAQIGVAVLTLIGVVVYLWQTRELSPESVTPEVELSRYFKWITWLASYTLVVFITGALGAESDAAWHQVVIRDTDFTPTHIELFYFCIPALIICGVGSFLYAKTRLPMHSDKAFVALAIAIGGPILIMPNVGYNEWGHTFFYAEEVFNASIHWGFSILGLALLGLGGVVIHIVKRMKELIDEVAARA